MKIVKEVLQIGEILNQNGFEAYLVGGCLRDLIIGVEPKDWDVATNALPAKVQELFPDSVYENSFGTVGVKSDSEDPRLKIIEVTTFRTEGGYGDNRRPDSVNFVLDINEDLSRRDFTINAMAFDLKNFSDGVLDEFQIVDPFDGRRDLEARVIRCVGDADERFNEDALRLLRAVRFSSQLDFRLSSETEASVKRNAHLLEKISIERITDEFSKLIMTEKAAEGIYYLQELNLLRYIIPELEEGVKMDQNQHHIYDVFEHNVKSLDYCAKQDYSFVVRLASLLHDVGKPATRRWKSSANGKRVRNGKNGDWTFYGHQVVGARMTKKILQRMKFSKEIVDKVSLLVHEHMFVYDPDVVTLAGVRRLISRIGESIDELIKVREADRIGSGVPKAQPYRLRYLLAMIDKVKSDPISPKMLAVNGNDLIKELGVKPGPVLGEVISILLEEVLDTPENNTREVLLKRAKELVELSSDERGELTRLAKKKALEVQENIDEEIKSRYFVN